MSTEIQVQCDYIDLTQAAEYCRKTYGTPTVASTVWRWATKGEDGIRLETRLVGKRHYRTTTVWLDEYFERLAEMSQVASNG